MTRAVLVHDDGPEAGMGHRRRMQILGSALEQRGVDVSHRASGSGEAELVVVDSYRWRADDTVRFRGAVVAAVDDLGRDLAVDVLVDPNPGPPVPRSRSRRVLTGTGYALIDGTLAARGAARPAGDVVRSVLVSAGASAQADGASLAEDVARLLADANVRLASGPWKAGCLPSDLVEPVDAPDGLAEELVLADMVVTAAGVTMIEALAAGRPTVAFADADNQRRAADGVAAAGAALVVARGNAAAAAARLAENRAQRRAFSTAATGLVGAHGPDRVAEELVALL